LDSSTDLRGVPDLGNPLRHSELGAPLRQTDLAVLQRRPEPAELLLQPQQVEPRLVQPAVQAEQADAVYREIIRTTHQCVLYGSGGFAVLCILVGAVEALFGR
jgi:hypothetical protein